MSRKNVIIIGGGPSALIAADFLTPTCNVIIYEKEKSVGQKFLVAGKGGFNLTNSLTGNYLVKKYTPPNFLREAILNFDSEAVRSWLNNLGIKTFIGTSGRVFSEKNYKPIEVLESIRTSLIKKDVSIYTNHTFVGFDRTNIPIIKNDNGIIKHSAEYYIFALGGSSWSITGSDGKWLSLFESIGIKTNPFESSNCGVNITWPKRISTHHIGKPLKNIEISVGNTKSRGEAVITEYGLEGNAIYSIVPELRQQLISENAEISIDFKPNNSLKQLQEKIKITNGSSQIYKKLFNLNGVEIALFKSTISKEEFLSPELFVNHLKSLKLNVSSLRPIDEAISTVGGVNLKGIDFDYSLKKHPNIFVIGEMADWDAPTGGFLLQGCFSMGVHVANSILSGS